MQLSIAYMRCLFLSSFYLGVVCLYILGWHIYYSSEQGNCFEVGGNKSTIIVGFDNKTHLTDISLERFNYYDIEYTPKDFQLIGIDAENDSHVLGEYTFSVTGPSVQFFKVSHHIERQFKFIAVDIHSSWGKRRWTCAKNLKVYGRDEVAE